MPIEMYRCPCHDSEFLRPRWCDLCQSPANIPFYPYDESPGRIVMYSEINPAPRPPRPYHYTRGKLGFEISVMAMSMIMVFRFAWWLIRNSAISIGSCAKSSAIGTAYGYRIIWWILTGR